MDGAVMSCIRTKVLEMVESMGIAAACTGTTCGPSECNLFQKAATTLLSNTLFIATTIGVNVFSACLQKMALNEKKYPVDLCTDVVSLP